jgi:hypothetical protein
MAWKHSSILGIATNRDPIFGGIVDKNCDGWFAIPQSNEIAMAQGFLTKEEAIEYIETRAKELVFSNLRKNNFYEIYG